MLSFGAATFWMNRPAPVEPLRARRAPMLLATLAFIAGILCARQWHAPSTLALTLALAFGVAYLALLRAPRLGWAAVLAAWMAVGCWSAELQPPIDQQTALHAYADGLSRTVRGRVVTVRSLADTPKVRSAPGGAVAPWLVEPGAWEGETGPTLQGLDLAVTAIEEVTPDISTMQPASGGLRLTFVGAVPVLGCGDVVEVPVRLREPEVYHDPGAFSYADWLLGQNIGALGTARAPALRRIAQESPGWRCRLGVWQHWAARRLQALPSSSAFSRLPAPFRLTTADAGMLAAMLFGDKTALSEEQRAGFERTGTFHLFVVSGMHVALFTGAVFWLLRQVRLPEPAAVALTILLGLGYALLTGFGIPAQRALAMCALFLLARALDRQHAGLNALGTAALLMLVADPRALYEASFQMTSLVILAVAGVAVPLSARLLGPWRTVAYQAATVELDAHLQPALAQRRVQMRMQGSLLADLTGWPGAAQLPFWLLRGTLIFAEALLVSVSIELLMALPMAFYFHRLAPLALPANLLVAPFAGVLAASAALTFALGLVSAWAALLPGAVTAFLLHVIRFAVDRLGQSRLGDLRTPGPSFLAIALCAVLAAVALIALRARRPFYASGGAVAACLLPLVVLWPTRPHLQPHVLEVTAIDVGQGDSVFLAAPDGETMLVDAGGPVGRLASRWDVGEQVVAPYLWSRQLRRLDVVVISHGHSDHIGGMPAVLRDLRPREMWLSLAPGESQAVRDLLAEAARLGVRVRWLAAGDTISWGGTTATVLSPERTYSNYGDATNDDSLVMRLDWHRASVLLEGDAERPSEDAMVAHGRLAPVTLLKVGHHGSRTSTNPEFLAAVAPRDAVISVGQHNTFAHPRWEVLERLEAAHVRTYRTDREGACTFLLHADGTVETGATSN